MNHKELYRESETRDGRRLVTRSYRPNDRERVRWICSETGFIGRPQENVFIGREIFADLWSSYWTDREPQSAFVAEVEGRVEGYILGCLDTKKQMAAWNKSILPRAAARMLRYSWWRHPLNRRFVRAYAGSARRGEFKVPYNEILPVFPAHLHTNIADPGLRGQGVGKAMMTALFDYLKDNGIKGVHLGTTSHNREAVPFYEHMGFKTHTRIHCTMYDHAIDDPPLYLLFMTRERESD